MLRFINPKPLIVTQQLIIAADLYIQMTKLKYDIIGICNSSIDALQTIKLNAPSIVLIDLSLKGSIDGAKLGALIQKQFSIPLIYLNPGMDKQSINLAIKTNPAAILNIPYETAEMENKINYINKQLNKGSIRFKLESCLDIE
ncbi:response regulator [Portibacter lacus]|uniref:Response regulatory domain-containing protein n=1 Tax=Portibacter lacus TaxID=1099794 RepID=A0AA37SV06_9BACT|nr:hypothetical protein [Portibacter lacus]GLR19675.1 hypothetical protein GCM10007940_42910 [Portibacter lacus]